MWHRGYTHRNRQPQPDRDVPRVPNQDHRHIRVPRLHMELPRPRGREIRLRDLPNQVQIPPTLDVNLNPPHLMHRPTRHRVRGLRQTLRCIDHHRLLLRRVVATPIRDHLRDLRPEVLLDPVQLWIGGGPHRVIPTKREDGGAPL